MIANGGVGPGEMPLSGMSVVELASIGPVPYACLLMAELGAKVTRFERPGAGALEATQAEELTRSRDTITEVDLRSAEGVARVLEAVATADVLVEGMRPGVAERLGVGPEGCMERDPHLVYGRMTGWGQSGPLAQRAGHDINNAAQSGALHAIGPRDRPRAPLNLVADFGGGSLFLVIGVLAALIERQRSGRGQIVDASMVDGAASLMAMVYGLHADGRWVDERESNVIDGGAPFYDTYECRDGKFVAVGAIEPQFFEALLEALEIDAPGEQYDANSWPRLRKLLRDTFRQRSRDEWTERLDGYDACVSPVLSVDEASRSPHARAREIFRPARSGFVPRAVPRFSRSITHEPHERRAAEPR